MKFVDEFRDDALARKISTSIAAAASPERRYRFMEFCGGHTHAISRHGIEDLLPENVRMIHGPGCPVCVLPTGRVDAAITLVNRENVVLCTYGDVMRVPGSHRTSLMKAKAGGADVRMVYSTLDAVRIAEQETDRQVVFFAIGFETTTPPTALAIKMAKARGLRNFLVLCNHVLTPPAIQTILQSSRSDGPESVKLDGLVGPAHVSTVIGTQPYLSLAEEFGTPIVVSGFEPLDVMQAIFMLICQVNAGRIDVENQYTRAVTRQGNRAAQSAVADVFEMRETFEWRGLGEVPDSALRIRKTYAEFDAEQRYQIPYIPAADNPACECAAVLRGVKRPQDCKLFGKGCTPETPMGSCMVSSEGSCAAHWTYGRFRDIHKSA